MPLLVASLPEFPLTLPPFPSPWSSSMPLLVASLPEFPLTLAPPSLPLVPVSPSIPTLVLAQKQCPCSALPRTHRRSPAQHLNATAPAQCRAGREPRPRQQRLKCARLDPKRSFRLICTIPVPHLVPSGSHSAILTLSSVHSFLTNGQFVRCHHGRWKEAGVGAPSHSVPSRGMPRPCLCRPQSARPSPRLGWLPTW